MAYLRDHLDDVEVMGAAVEEMIRYSCPFVRMRRTATQDVQLHGKTIKKGDQILMLYPAANRDPRAFDDPQHFDVRRRSKRPSLSFGIGKHFCLGAALARLEPRIALETLLRRLPDIHVTPGADVRMARGCFVRALVDLPVSFTPVAP